MLLRSQCYCCSCYCSHTASAASDIDTIITANVTAVTELLLFLFCGRTAAAASGIDTITATDVTAVTVLLLKLT
jgi:hypothetical protein